MKKRFYNLSEGMGFDGSSVEGFARIEESDMIAKPDPTTLQLVPWRTAPIEEDIYEITRAEKTWN